MNNINLMELFGWALVIVGIAQGLCVYYPYINSKFNLFLFLFSFMNLFSATGVIYLWIENRKENPKKDRLGKVFLTLFMVLAIFFFLFILMATYAFWKMGRS